MPVAVCPNGHRLQIQDAHAGRTITCPMCQTSFVATPQPGGPSGPPTPPGAADGGFTDMGGGGGAMMGPPGGVRRQKMSPEQMASKVNWLIGKPLLFIGLVLVLFGRGCDAISMRSVGRTTAYYELAKSKAFKELKDSD